MGRELGVKNRGRRRKERKLRVVFFLYILHGNKCMGKREGQGREARAVQSRGFSVPPKWASYPFTLPAARTGDISQEHASLGSGAG